MFLITELYPYLAQLHTTPHANSYVPACWVHVWGCCVGAELEAAGRRPACLGREGLCRTSPPGGQSGSPPHTGRRFVTPHTPPQRYRAGGICFIWGRNILAVARWEYLQQMCLKRISGQTVERLLQGCLVNGGAAFSITSTTTGALLPSSWKNAEPSCLRYAWVNFTDY